MWGRFGKGREKRADFEAAVLAHLDALYGYAMALTRSPEAAAELVQETCYRAVRGARREVPGGDLKPWLFTILRHIWINQRRRQTRGPEFVPLMAEGADGALPDRWLVDDRLCPEQLLEQARLHRHLQGAIECLPEAFREVIVLRYFEGLSYAEIAQVLGCPAGTVMSRLSRAKAALRRQLRHLTEQEEAPVRRPEQHEG